MGTQELRDGADNRDRTYKTFVKDAG